MGVQGRGVISAAVCVDKVYKKENKVYLFVGKVIKSQLNQAVFIKFTDNEGYD